MSLGPHILCSFQETASGDSSRDPLPAAAVKRRTPEGAWNLAGMAAAPSCFPKPAGAGRGCPGWERSSPESRPDSCLSQRLERAGASPQKGRAGLRSTVLSL